VTRKRTATRPQRWPNKPATWPWRSQQGGHSVPEDKVRERYQRLWGLVAQALRMADTASVYDNSNSRTPYRRVARFEKGRLLGPAHYPAWSAPQAALLAQES
jgi:predicted ABC-type ATPase